MPDPTIFRTESTQLLNVHGNKFSCAKTNGSNAQLIKVHVHADGSKYCVLALILLVTLVMVKKFD